MADDKKKIRVTRRRRTDQDGERKRAEAPSREKEDNRASSKPPRQSGGGSSRPPSGAGLPMGGSGRGLSPKMLLILGAIFVIVIVCGMVFNLLPGGSESGSSGGGEAPAQQSQAIEPAAPSMPTPELATTESFQVPVPSQSDGSTWLVMLYQDADDKILEQDIFLDFNEAERVGSNDRVHIVSQIDRFSRGFSGDGNWDTTKRFYVTFDPNLNQSSSQEIVDLGEVNMASGDSLVDFVSWAIETFPADKHALIMSDHGMGWPGGWTDPDPGGRGQDDVVLASILGDELFLMEIDRALGEIRDRTGVEKLELIGMDACLMSHLEVYDALAPHARYAVASQETEPALGWAYTGFLGDLTKNPDMDGEELARLIVESYIDEDQRIVDDEARAEYTGRGSPMAGILGMFGGISADQLAAQMQNDITLTAVDLQQIPQVMDSLNELSYQMQGIRQPVVAQARSYARSYTSVFGKSVPPSYLDLGNFAQLIKRESADAQVGRTVDQLLADIDRAVIAERHGSNKNGSTGISIYFPNSKLYQAPAAGPQSYTEVAERFAQESLWDDFLAYHYTGRRFEEAQGTLAVPDQGAAVSAPGSGKLTTGQLTVSDNEAAPGEPIFFSADVSGENLGYAYIYTGFLDEDSNSIFVADLDYLETGDTLEMDGVYYPAWPAGEFTMEFEWEPLMFSIYDGENSALALFSPESYGADPEDAIYTVDGIYTYADDGSQRHARLYFNNNNGLLNQVYGFTGDGATGAAREILPQIRDTFTVLEQWTDLVPSGTATTFATQEGKTLTFGSEPFTWEELDAAPGSYVVGFVFEDLDGNRIPLFERITVR